MATVIRVYISTSPGSLDKKKRMERTVNVLNGFASRMGYTLETIDVADLENKEAKDFMLSNGHKDDKGQVAAPQIFNGDEVCGNYDEFDFAVEDERLKDFLHLPS